MISFSVFRMAAVLFFAAEWYRTFTVKPGKKTEKYIIAKEGWYGNEEGTAKKNYKGKSIAFL